MSTRRLVLLCAGWFILGILWGMWVLWVFV